MVTGAGCLKALLARMVFIVFNITKFSYYANFIRYFFYYFSCFLFGSFIGFIILNAIGLNSRTASRRQSSSVWFHIIFFIFFLAFIWDSRFFYYIKSNIFLQWGIHGQVAFTLVWLYLPNVKVMLKT